MTLLNIANEDMTFEFTNPPTGIPPTIPPDASPPVLDPGIDLVKIVPTLSTKCKADGSRIGTTGVTLTWSLATESPCPFTSVLYEFIAGAGSVTPSAIKTKAESQLVLREGDVGTCRGSWIQIASPFATVYCSCKVELIDAGQTKVKAE